MILQPAEGRYKVYILDEAHQLTDAAWNALLKLIEEPPPHLVFVFCTTDLAKVLPTVRSRCQSFVFARPRLPSLVRVLRRIADAEQIEVPDAALALIARGGRGSFRDAVSTLDQLASATGNQIDVQSVLQLLGAVEEDALFRLCDAIVDRDTAGALTFLEELAEQGQDLGRLVTDLLEHLRHLLLVQHMGHVPDSLPVTDETRERLREQANQLPAPTVLRLRPARGRGRGLTPGRRPAPAARARAREGDEPRLRPLARVARVQGRPARAAADGDATARCRSSPGGRRAERADARRAAAGAGSSGGQRREPAARARPAAGRVAAHCPPRCPVAFDPGRVAARRGATRLLEGETLTLEFPASADFHRRQAEEPKNVTVIREALYEVTGHRLGITLALGEDVEADDDDEQLTEEALISMFKDTFDAQEVEETR